MVATAPVFKVPAVAKTKPKGKHLTSTYEFISR
jgi:hypothetical protein